MSENEFPEVPQPPAIPEAEAVPPIPILDQLPNDWRRKVALGLLLGIAHILLGQVVSILFGLQEEPKSQNLIWICNLCLLPIDIASIWLITTPLIGQPALFLRLRKLYRFFGISGSLLILVMALLWLSPFENPKKAAPIYVGFALVMFFLGGGASLFSVWFFQKLAVLAEDNILRKLFGFFKWLAIIFIILMAIGLGIAFSFYTEIVSEFPENMSTSMPAEATKEPMSVFGIFFTLLFAALFCWPFVRLYKRIRVPAGRLEAEQFAGDMNGEQSFGD